MTTDPVIADLNRYEAAEAETERRIEGNLNQARQELIDEWLADPGTVLNGMADFADHEVHNLVRPLIAAQDDAALGRLVRERVQRCVEDCFTPGDVRERALELGGGPVRY